MPQADMAIVVRHPHPFSRMAVPQSPAIRCVLALAFVALFLGADAALHADETFPYTAYVSSQSSAKIHSGPGLDYYATDQLEQGSEVVVYQHVGQQWAAIRPPEGSHSLVPIGALEVSGADDLGTVRNEVKTIVGSRLSSLQHDVEYITLQPGDVVQILGSREIALEDGQDLVCYEISPPAGEFRWIRTEDLSREPVEQKKSLSERLADIRRRSTTRNDSTSELVGDGIILSPIRDSLEYETPEEEKIELAPTPAEYLVQPIQFLADRKNSEQPAPKLLEAPSLPAGGPSQDSLAGPTILPSERSSAVPNDKISEAWNSPGDSAETDGRLNDLLAPPGNSLDPPPLGSYAEPDAPLSAESPLQQEVALPQKSGATGFRSDFRAPIKLGPIGKLRLGQELIDIELQLTKQVCQAPSTWRLSELHDRAQAVIDTSDDPKQRLVARNVIAKIAQFEDVRRRQKTIVARNYDVNSPGNRLASTNVLGEPAYDGTGFLMPVVTQDPSMPKYVLTDKDGNIIQFVSPKPGINLKRFEQQRVAILGERGYLPTYNQPHLMAERVITLDKVR